MSEKNIWSNFNFDKIADDLIENTKRTEVEKEYERINRLAKEATEEEKNKKKIMNIFRY